MSQIEYNAIIEGILFLVGDEGCSLKDIAKVIELPVKDTEIILQEMAEKYDNDVTSGLTLVFLGHKYKLATKVIYRSFYEKMVDQVAASLSNAALETLAIIAYNQPVTRHAVEEIRGVSSDSMIRKLQAKALIKEMGRDDTPGKPILYGVSEEFMDAFNLASLDELPDINVDTKTELGEDLFDAKYREQQDI